MELHSGDLSDDSTATELSNKGNFQLLKLRIDHKLKTYLETCQRNARYIPKISLDVLLIA